MEEVKNEVVNENAFDNAVKEAVKEVFGDLQAQIDTLKSAISASAAPESDIELNGATTGETGRETPDKRVDFSKLSYSELCSFLEKHPRTKL